MNRIRMRARSRFRRATAPAIAAGALCFGLPAPAAAAPQVLGLVVSAGATPLACDATACRAELSSFCLQQPRANPLPYTAYSPADGAAIFLVGTDLEGAAVRLPAAPYVRFASARGFTAVEATIPAATLRALGLAAAAIEVGRDAALLPAAVDRDPDPQSADEIAAAIGPVRQAAEPFFDEAGESSDGIRATSAMINALPATGRSPTDGDGHLLLAIGTATAGDRDHAGGVLARSLHAACVAKVDVTHHIYSMRDCLEGSHDRLVVKTNIRFWDSLGGS